MPREITQNKNVSEAKVLPEILFGSVTQLQWGSALNSVAQVVTKAHTEALDKGRSLQFGLNQEGHATVGTV